MLKTEFKVNSLLKFNAYFFEEATYLGIANECMKRSFDFFWFSPRGTLVSGIQYSLISQNVACVKTLRSVRRNNKEQKAFLSVCYSALTVELHPWLRSVLRCVQPQLAMVQNYQLNIMTEEPFILSVLFIVVQEDINWWRLRRRYVVAAYSLNWIKSLQQNIKG